VFITRQTSLAICCCRQMGCSLTFLLGRALLPMPGYKITKAYKVSMNKSSLPPEWYAATPDALLVYFSIARLSNLHRQVLV
jgi:hypothetical protein